LENNRFAPHESLSLPGTDELWPDADPIAYPAGGAQFTEPIAPAPAPRGNGAATRPAPPDPAPLPPPRPAPPRAPVAARPPAGAPRANPGNARLERLLQYAASRGASALYLASNAQPSIRVDGEMLTLDDAPVFEPQQVEALLLGLVLAHDRDPRVLFDETSEWSLELPEAGGLVRCFSFRDGRGPGAAFRLQPPTVDEPAHELSPEVQALALERSGLVLIAGPRASGKRAVMRGLLDIVSRSRRAHVISVERDDDAPAGGPEAAFVSRRVVRGSLDDLTAAARLALRENPDVLLLQEIGTASLAALALDGAASGQLVIAGFTTPTVAGALERILYLYPPERLRGIVGQVQVRKTEGGRVAAHEVIVNTPALARVLVDGKPWHLAVAVEAALKQSGSPLTSALAQLVAHGIVGAEEAYRRAPDPSELLEQLHERGVDTSFAVPPEQS
jgi:twitching motility protein PilT